MIMRLARTLPRRWIKQGTQKKEEIKETKTNEDQDTKQKHWQLVIGLESESSLSKSLIIGLRLKFKLYQHSACMD